MSRPPLLGLAIMWAGYTLAYWGWLRLQGDGFLFDPAKGGGGAITLRALVTPGKSPYIHESDALSGQGVASNPPSVNKQGSSGG